MLRLFTATALALMMLAPTVVAAPREESQTYLTSGVGATCATGAANPINRGVVCIRVAADDAHVAVAIHDDFVGDSLGGFYQVLFGTGLGTPVTPFCGGSFELDLPEGARTLRVTVGRAPNDAVCPGLGVAGTVTATFS